MSLCITASCLAHRKTVFVWLLDGAPYPWVHTDCWPCAAVTPLTAEQAEEVCGCGHAPHAAPPGLPAWPRSEKDRPCLLCDCPDFWHRWQADRRAVRSGC
jgi:hypothetical protein